jgi:hypothetical protein
MKYNKIQNRSQKNSHSCVPLSEWLELRLEIRGFDYNPILHIIFLENHVQASKTVLQNIILMKNPDERHHEGYRLRQAESDLVELTCSLQWKTSWRL